VALHCATNNERDSDHNRPNNPGIDPTAKMPSRRTHLAKIVQAVILDTVMALRALPARRIIAEYLRRYRPMPQDESKEDNVAKRIEPANNEQHRRHGRL
jgi:hypothetical protein